MYFNLSENKSDEPIMFLPIFYTRALFIPD